MAGLPSIELTRRVNWADCVELLNPQGGYKLGDLISMSDRVGKSWENLVTFDGVEKTVKEVPWKKPAIEGSQESIENKHEK